MVPFKVPWLSRRVDGLIGSSDMVGDEATELAEEVLPKRRWVVWWCLVPRSQKGQCSGRFSQPASLSFSGQLARLFAGSQGRTS